MLNCYDRLIQNMKKPVFKNDIEDITNKEKKLIHIMKRERANTLFNTQFDFGSLSIPNKSNVTNGNGSSNANTSSNNNNSNSEKKMEIPKFNPLANIGKFYNKFDEVNWNK
jgi:hypothetical protein